MGFSGLGIIHLGLEQNLATCNFSWEPAQNTAAPGLCFPNVVCSWPSPIRSPVICLVGPWGCKESGHSSSNLGPDSEAEQVRVYCCDSGEEIFLRLVWLPGSTSCCSAPPSLASVHMDGVSFPRVSLFLSLWQHSSAIVHVSAQTSPPPPGSLPWFSKQNQLSVPSSLSLQQALESPVRPLLSCSCNTCLFTHLPSSLDCVLLNTSSNP